jgi:hypothetical protein
VSKYPIIHMPGPSWLRKNPYAAKNLWHEAIMHVQADRAWASKSHAEKERIRRDPFLRTFLRKGQL